jgi:hypothetical protein
MAEFKAGEIVRRPTATGLPRTLLGFYVGQALCRVGIHRTGEVLGARVCWRATCDWSGSRGHVTAWVLLVLATIAGALSEPAFDHHLTTDPACIRYRAPKTNSRLERASRGVGCLVCMRRAAFGDEGCRLYTVDLKRVSSRSEADRA